MPLPASWVDHLFAKLSVRWGAAFLSQWPADTDPNLVKADWAEVLDGVSGASITYALSVLPEKPLNAITFRQLCRAAPAKPAAAITDARPPADTKRLQSIVAGLNRTLDHASPAQMCADNILRIAERDDRMTNPQRQQLEAMARMLTPAQRERCARWMPGMRAAVEGGE